MTRRKVRDAAPPRPMGGPNRGVGKELTREDLALPIPERPRNRRERRAKAAWERKQARESR